MTDRHEGRHGDDEGHRGSDKECEGNDKGAGDDRGDGNDKDEGNGRGEDDESGRGVRFTLPPIRLPPIVPETFRFVVPPVRRRTGAVSARTVLAVALAFDLVDASLALGVASGEPTLHWARVGVGVVLAAVLVGSRGLVYGWEGVAVAGGVLAPTTIPTLSALVLLGLRRERVEGRHPELLDGDAERERERPEEEE